MLFIPLAVTGYVWNITKVLECCQILEWKKDVLNRDNYMVSTIYICRNVRESSVGNLSPAMGARNHVGIGLSYRPASLCSLSTQFKTRFLELIPRLIAELKFSTQSCCVLLS